MVRRLLLRLHAAGANVFQDPLVRGDRPTLSGGKPVGDALSILPGGRGVPARINATLCPPGGPAIPYPGRHRMARVGNSGLRLTDRSPRCPVCTGTCWGGGRPRVEEPG